MSIVVTILILVDGFLQFLLRGLTLSKLKSHNPYFSRWFSAINGDVLDDSMLSESQSLF